MTGPSTRRAALGAILAAPITGGVVMALPSGPAQPMAHADSTDLARLVQESERADLAVDAYSDREDRDDNFGSTEEWLAVTRAAGHARGAVALYPAQSMSEVLLKVRALRTNTSAASEEEELHEDLNRANGHAYSVDIIRSVAIDLLRLTEGTQCT